MQRSRQGEVNQDARDTLNAINKLPKGTALRDHAETRSFNQSRWILKAFRECHKSTRTGNADTREVGNVTQLEPTNDILDSTHLTTEEKRSSLRYVLHRFPQYIKPTKEEAEVLKLILRQNVWGTERRRLTEVLRVVHHQDAKDMRLVLAANKKFKKKQSKDLKIQMTKAEGR